jgi:multiple antibiotic resistance protein
VTSELTVWSVALLLFLVMDPLGNAPVFVSVLSRVEESRRPMVVLREMVIALGVLVAFVFGGPWLLRLMGISGVALEIAGGIVLFLIAIKMVFPPSTTGSAFVDDAFGEEPFIVPMAIPFVAGPSAIATILVVLGREPDRWPAWLLALFMAWAVSCAILLSAAKLSARLGRRGMVAIERLMGMVVVAIGVEMMVRGVRTLVEDIQASGAAG